MKQGLIKLLKSTTGCSLLMAAVIFIISRLTPASFIELYYSSGFYSIVSTPLLLISNALPFSLDDLLYGFLIVYLLTLILMTLLRKLAFVSFIKRIVLLTAVVYSLFVLFWGFNYHRSSLNDRLGLPSAKANADELMQVFKKLIADLNTTYTPIYTLDKESVLHSVQSAYRSHASFLQIDTTLLKCTPKPITLSRFFASATISGYYGPFFSEVHINHYLLTIDYPAVLAHEMAHRLGIASEAEANFYAWLVCSTSDDKRLAYSANLHLLHYFVYECYKLPGFKEAVKDLRYEVKHDFYKSNYHWLKLMNRNVEFVATKVNDAYLKSNSLEEGIEDYDGVVKYVMDYTKYTAE